MTQTGRFLTTRLWPLVLAAKLAHYGLYDRPPHVLLWEADHVIHAVINGIAAVLVLVTMGSTTVRLLRIKAFVVTSIALTSATADLLLDRPFLRRGVGSGLTWATIGIANLAMVMWRISRLDDKARA